MLRETEDESDETRYMLKGRDFCLDLCLVLDILTPLVQMMNKAQSLSLLLWSGRKWWQRVRALFGGTRGRPSGASEGSPHSIDQRDERDYPLKDSRPLRDSERAKRRRLHFPERETTRAGWPLHRRGYRPRTSGHKRGPKS